MSGLLFITVNDTFFQIQTPGGAFWQRNCVCTNMNFTQIPEATNGDAKVTYQCRNRRPDGSLTSISGMYHKSKVLGFVTENGHAICHTIAVRSQGQGILHGQLYHCSSIMSFKCDRLFVTEKGQVAYHWNKFHFFWTDMYICIISKTSLCNPFYRNDIEMFFSAHFYIFPASLIEMVEPGKWTQSNDLNPFSRVSTCMHLLIKTHLVNCGRNLHVQANQSV